MDDHEQVWHTRREAPAGELPGDVDDKDLCHAHDAIVVPPTQDIAPSETGHDAVPPSAGRDGWDEVDVLRRKLRQLTDALISFFFPLEEVAAADDRRITMIRLLISEATLSQRRRIASWLGARPELTEEDAGELRRWADHGDAGE
ncbi:MAG TPA: hypothetical protein VGN81_16015 [Pseudonocardiaceae bacterium]|jgi:hypothetical protein